MIINYHPSTQAPITPLAISRCQVFGLRATGSAWPGCYASSVNDGFITRDLGRLDYASAYQEQRRTHAAVASGASPPTLLLVEHPPTITFGKKGGRGNLLVAESWLRQQGFDLFDIERGGDVTYHGPGQLVGYPIFPVERRVQWFLRAIEDALIALLADYSIAASGSPGYAGVWVGDDKIAAIGVAIQRGVAFHGFALNVCTDLTHFNYIIPCGIRDKGVTSLSRLLAREVTLAEVKPKLVAAFHAQFDAALRHGTQHELLG